MDLYCFSKQKSGNVYFLYENIQKFVSCVVYRLFIFFFLNYSVLYGQWFQSKPLHSISVNVSELVLQELQFSYELGLQNRRALELSVAWKPGLWQSNKRWQAPIGVSLENLIMLMPFSSGYMADIGWKSWSKTRKQGTDFSCSFHGFYRLIQYNSHELSDGFPISHQTWVRKSQVQHQTGLQAWVSMRRYYLQGEKSWGWYWELYSGIGFRVHYISDLISHEANESKTTLLQLSEARLDNYFDLKPAFYLGFKIGVCKTYVRKVSH